MSIDPFASPPVYEENQVITVVDLEALIISIGEKHRQTPWWRFQEREGLVYAQATLFGIRNWLSNGKPETIRF